MPTKGFVYYSDGQLDPAIAQACLTQLNKCLDSTVVDISPELCISTVTLKDIQLPEGWPPNTVLNLERCYLTMFRQILAGLETLDTEVAFLVEHDVLYSPTHFDFTPPRDDTYYYNRNVWKVVADSGHAFHYPCSQTSGLCASRNLLVNHYRARVEMCEQAGFSMKMGFEPGTHGRAERVDNFKADYWMSPIPNIDIRHTSNLTKTKTSPSDFRNPQFAAGWTESDSVPGWGRTEGRFSEFLTELSK